jgi:hypothetical protein
VPRALLVREVDEQDRVLGDEANQEDHADLAVEVDRLTHEPERGEGTERRERHGEHHGERVQEALELCREHQIDDHEREGEGEVDLRRRLAELARGAAQRCREAGRNSNRAPLTDASLSKSGAAGAGGRTCDTR